MLIEKGNKTTITNTYPVIYSNEYIILVPLLKKLIFKIRNHRPKMPVPCQN